MMGWISTSRMFKALEEYNIPIMPILIIFLATGFGVLYHYQSASILWKVFSVVWFLAPFWAPPILIAVFAKVWMIYKRSEFIKNQQHTLLEIRLPREIRKSPLAMEAVLSGVHRSLGEGTPIDIYLKGKVRPWFSLELVSIEGEVRFFIWTRTFLKNLVEAQVYAQYPEVEIHEVDDYSRFVKFDPNEMSLWGCDHILTKPDPYPIKTYIDYGLENAGAKEEEKVDPLASVIEWLGAIGKGEQVWVQIMIRVNKTHWKDDAQKIISEMLGRDPKTKLPANLVGTMSVNVQLSKGEQEVIAAIDRSMNKLAFDCGIRTIYMAKKDTFNAINIVSMVSMFKQFSSNTLNGFRPANWLIKFAGYPWEDYKEIRKNTARTRILEAYKRRSYFHPPFTTKAIVLNTEELATIYHFPGSVIQTPTLRRTPSKKAEAPINLPR
jgi:hypothetical protein